MRSKYSVSWYLQFGDGIQCRGTTAWFDTRRQAERLVTDLRKWNRRHPDEESVHIELSSIEHGILYIIKPRSWWWRFRARLPF